MKFLFVIILSVGIPLALVARHSSGSWAAVRVLVVLAVILLVIICLPGCAAHAHQNELVFSSLWGIGGISLGLAVTAFMFGGFKDGLELARWFLLAAVVAFLSGCAALPMPLQPVNEQYNSNYAEGGFLVLATVDTLQTMHIRQGTSCDHEADPVAAALYGSRYPKPGRVLLTNLALITVHTMVTSWLDDKVAEHAHDDSAGPWYVGRIAWHGVSLFVEGAAVVSNHSRGCAL